MQIKGTIKAEKPMKSGVTASGKEWRSKRYLMSHEMNGQWEKQIAFDVLGDDIERFDLKVGSTYTVDIDVTTHEHNGEWYNSVKAWRVHNEQQTAQPNGTFESKMNQEQKDDPKKEDLPF